MKPEQLQPDRVWTLTPENEIVLKQVWGKFFKYFGYDLNVSLEDLEHGTNLVSSERDSQLLNGSARRW